MAQHLELVDTFGIWRTKINTIADEINQLSVDFDDLAAVVNAPTAFGYTSITGLNVSMIGGRVRDGSDIETLANEVITLTPSATNIIAIYKKSDEPADLRNYLIDDLPEEYVIPLLSLITNATNVTSIADLRTEFNTASGSAGSAAGILQFDKLIENDVIIPANRNGLSVGPIVADGVTVTVTDGSEWVIL